MTVSPVLSHRSCPKHDMNIQENGINDHDLMH